MRGVSKVLDASGELRLASKRSGVSGPSMDYDWGIRYSRLWFNTPMSDRSHLSFCPTNCPGKTKFYIKSK